jgi:hypothetical protein
MRGEGFRVVPGTTKIWAAVLAVPVVFVLGHLLLHYDSGAADPLSSPEFKSFPKTGTSHTFTAGRRLR